ncbi:MAG: sensor histidine kinase, partial [Lachnospiraceae bacterium]|nr:sensor histidine kinase [Lachnospiraceae bacterium]
MKGSNVLKSFSLYQKFALTIVLLGLLPMAVLATFIANKMIKDYSLALTGQYEQAAGYVASSVESMLDSYNTISKMPYFYNFDAYGAQSSYLSFDHFRQVLYGEGYDPDTLEEDRKRDMGLFLQYIQSVDAYISGVHVIAQDDKGEKQSFHYSVYNTFFLDPELFENNVSYEELDKTGKNLILLPPHTTAYFYGTPESVFTVARNYFDLRGPVGNTP